MTDSCNYDAVADAFDHRYRRNQYAGVRDALLDFVAGADSVLEVGCGTGHWLALLANDAAYGVDASWGMLQHARVAAPRAMLAHGRAEALPIASASMDRVVAINAMHHFVDKIAFVAEARRVLRPGGGALTVGLDPHTGTDQWWIYDFFPGTRATDLRRYPSTSAIREMMASAGFGSCETTVAQHVPAAVSVREARARGSMDRNSTSQLMLLSDEEYRAGVQRIAVTVPGAGEREPTLHADLRLYATTAWLPT
ncbi:MAG: class I SAM-dependent methyltransferase [Gemmatimonadaceae bacterium]